MTENKTVKTLKAQLMAAIAMVLVAALALGSSTFAWFANNNQVKADGLKISASTEGTALAISDTANVATQADAGTSKTFAFSTAQALYPTHVALGTITDYAGTVGAWTHGYSSEYNAAITDKTEEHTLTIATSAAGTDEGGLLGTGTDTQDSTWVKPVYIKDTMYVAVKTGLGYDHLNVSQVTISADASDDAEAIAGLLPSARVMLVTGGKAFLFNKDGVCSVEGTADGKTGFTFNTLGDGSESKPYLADLGAVTTADKEIEVYVFFDGRDAACKSANFSDKGIKVELTLTGTGEKTST